MLVATVRGARGSRVRLFHGLTGTKAHRRRRARPPIFIRSGRPDRAMSDCFGSARALDAREPLGEEGAQELRLLVG